MLQVEGCSPFGTAHRCTPRVSPQDKQLHQSSADEASPAIGCAADALSKACSFGSLRRGSVALHIGEGWRTRRERTSQGALTERGMLWPFNHFRKPRLPPRGTIEAIYGMIVTQAREPLFYRDLGVPDTVNGRFDLLLLHLWMVLRRLRSVAEGTDVAQALFDHFCNDLDANLREMGVGDRKSTRLNSSHRSLSRMPSSA